MKLRLNVERVTSAVGAIETAQKFSSIKDLSEWKGILIFIEYTDRCRLHPSALELINLAQSLAAQLGCEISCVVIGHEADLSILKGFGIARIYHYSFAKINCFEESAYSASVIHCIKKLKPEIVLLGATAIGRTIAPRIAIHFKTGLTADCTQLDIDGDRNLVQTRPTFGGNLYARITTENTRPQMATVHCNIIAPATANPFETLGPRIIRIDTPLYYDESHHYEVAAFETITLSDDISSKKALVAIGNGVAEKKDILLFHDFARSINATLVSTRALVEKGWMPPDHQIGLTGKSVAAELLITFGVSGSVQFCAGIKNVKRIIAVNNDLDAPIFQYAHIGLHGDMYEILDKLS